MVRPPAEVVYGEELGALISADTNSKPPGWKMSPRFVRQFIVGGDSAITHNWQGSKTKTTISQKFFGDDALVERCIVTLLGNRGLLLVGEPGTAKSMLSELLSAAISGNSLMTIQGTADKCIQVPELPGQDSVRFAEKGFNIIATANLRDRGVHEMSSALKRRFNFETVAPLADKAMELRLVKEQTEALLRESFVKVECPNDVLDLLVTTFNDLRHGRTEEGTVVEKPSTVMSTAEAVAVSHSAALDAAYFGNSKLESGHVARQLLGTVLKDNPDDLKKLQHYFDVVVKARGKESKTWQQFYEAKKWLRG